jgi:ribose transport system substrate-binding protein
VVTAAAALVLAAVLASCSSSSSDGTNKPSSSTGNSSSPSSQLASLSAQVKNAENPATSLSVTEPLKSKPAAGKSIIWMNCDVNVCAPIGQGVEAAAKAIGWSFRKINYSSANPATLVSGMQRALQYHPSYVIVTGVPPEAGWNTLIPKYQAANVKIISGFLGQETYGHTFIANIGGATLASDAGTTLAKWFIADSGGKGRALLQSVNDFPTIKLTADSFASTVAKLCPACQVIRLNNTAAQAVSGAVPSAIVSDLRSHPQLGYVITPAANLTDGLSAALSGAGLENKVKWAGYAPDPAVLAALKANKAAAMIGTPYSYVGWEAVDTALRDSEGMPFQPDPIIPFQLLLPTTTFTIAQSEDVPANYAAQFKKLWLVG